MTIAEKQISDMISAMSDDEKRIVVKSIKASILMDEINDRYNRRRQEMGDKNE